MRLIRICTLLVLPLLLLDGARAQEQNLVINGDFEGGLASWTTWAAAPSSFWNGVWLQSNDCVIWVPTNGCPYEGAISHAQTKGSGGGNTHGGLYQVLSVVPGQNYAVSGYWSGGVTGNVAGNNGSWWEVVVFDGVVSDAVIDAGTRGPQDVLIAKQEVNNLGNNEVFQFQWEPFAGSFVAQSDTVTFVLKAGSFFTFDAAAYHDVVSVTAAVQEPVPALNNWALALLVLLMPLLVVLRRYRLV